MLSRNRCLKDNSSANFRQAQVKVIIICCCYVVIGLGACLAFALSSTILRDLQRELIDYFECERCSVNSGRMCERIGFERLTNPPLVTVGYSLLALYPVITLVYVIRIKRSRKVHTKQTLNMASVEVTQSSESK